MCQACRALVDPSANPCPMCGRESVPSLSARINATTGSAFFISFVILTINILLFVLMAVVEINNGKGGEAFIQSASNEVLDDFGALVPSAVAAGQWWRLVTFNFLHIGLMHLFFNSTALYQIGPQVEELYGSQKFILIYLVTGVFSAYASYIFNIAGAGASGSIFGLIGLMTIYGYRQGGVFGKAIMRQMITWAVMGFLFGVMIGANNVAHASGFAAGAGLGFAINPDAAVTNRAAMAWNALAIICVLAIASSFAMAGIGYGSMQVAARERERIQQERDAGAQNVILLSNRINTLRELLGTAQEIKTGAEKDKLVDSLKTAAADIDRVPQIDDESTEIRRRIVELINKITNESAGAGKEETALFVSLMNHYEELGKALSAHSAWESNVLKKYGLVYK